MKTLTRTSSCAILLFALTGASVTTSAAALNSEKKVSPKQILLDTGGGGGEGSALPGVNWTFAETPQGSHSFSGLGLQKTKN